MITRNITIVFKKGAYREEIESCIDQIERHAAVSQVIELDE